MSDLSFEQMLEESLKTIRTGEVVKGTVISVKEDEIVLNIGYKSDGIITRNEYTNTPNVDLTTVVSVGDSMDAKVLKVNDGEGQVLLTYKRLAAEKASKMLEEAFENKIADGIIAINKLNPEIKEVSQLPEGVLQRAEDEGISIREAYLLQEFNNRRAIEAAESAEKSAKEKSSGSLKDTAGNEMSSADKEFLSGLWGR